MVSSRKKFFYKLYTFLSILLMFLVVCLYVSFRPIKVSASSYPATIPMTPVVQGFDKPFQLYKTSVDSTNFNFYYSYIDFRTAASGGYAYEVINLGSDNSHIDTVIICMMSNGYNDNFFFNWEHAIECGFYSGVVGASNYFDAISLDFYIPRSYFLSNNQNSSVICYVDVSNYNIVAEGNVYFVVRYTEAYRQNYSIGGGRPEVLFWDLKFNSDFGDYYNQAYNAGATYGRETGYSEGYQRGYYYGELAGEAMASGDYGINDLLFSIFDAPYQVMYNVFSFTIFGVQFWTIIVSLLIILVLLWVVKRFLR